MIIAFDLETALIRPARLAPPPACMTWQCPGEAPGICDSAGIAARMRGWLDDRSVRLVGHNVAFDIAVLLEAYPDLRPALFGAYDDDRVTDTLIREKLVDIARGRLGGFVVPSGAWVPRKYDLATVARRNTGMALQKDAWRTSYAAFIGLPLSAWPARALEVQAEAREELATLRAAWAHVRSRDVPTAIEERFSALESMIAGDPNRCVEYPLEDATATIETYLAQEKHAAYLHDQYRQTRAALWLHLSSAWGLRTDGPGIDVFRREVEAEYADLKRDLSDPSLSRGPLVRSDGSRDTKAAKRQMLHVCREEGLPVRRTEGHVRALRPGEESKCKQLDGTPLPHGHPDCGEHVCLDAEACATTGDDVLVDYAQFSTLAKVLKTDIAKVLLLGATYPLHPRYGIAETGRTTCYAPNVQNLRRKSGIREAFVPRPGRVFAQADFPTLELFALAQCCIEWVGSSRLGEALNAGVDPHLRLGAQLLKISYEEAAANKKRPDVRRARQLAKAANFGFPGGMGPAKMIAATRKQMITGAPSYEEGLAAWRDLDLTEARAADLKDQWLKAWPELPHYFARADQLCDNADKRSFSESLYTRRSRGGATYCATSNTGFQGLAADCAKEAGWRICRAQYVEPESPLFNSRTVAFVHDEFIVEVDDAPSAHDAAYELARLMAEGANVYLPDVPIPVSKMEPLLMRRWSKSAEQRVDADGRLVPWG